MPGILALDLATNIGWAALRLRDDPPWYGSHKLPSTGADVGRFLDEYEAWLVPQIKSQMPAVIVYEAPVLPPKTQIITLRKLYSLAGFTELVARRHGVECREAHMQSARKVVLGHGRPGKGKELKQNIMAYCRLRGWNPRNDDEADALVILEYAIAKLNSDLDSARLFGTAAA